MTTMIIITIVIAFVLILLSYTISHKNTYPVTFTNVNDEGEKRSQYECGLEPFEDELGKENRERFYIKFYIIGILFLIFDLETLLLFPASLLFFSSTSIPSLISPIVKNTDLDTLSITTHLLNSDWLIYKSFTVFLIFILLLLLGLYYEYRKNVL